MKNLGKTSSSTDLASQGDILRGPRAFTRGPKILLPFYIYPSSAYTNPQYNQLIDAARQHPEIQFNIILNNSNGPGGARDLNFVVAIKRLRACSNVRILGYVDTNYGNRLNSLVRTDIDLWKSWYQPDGIFLDQMDASTNMTRVQAVRSLTDYIHNSGLHLSIGNPGTDIPSIHLENRTADVFVIYENSGLPGEPFLRGDFEGGHADYSTDVFAAILHSQSTFSPTAAKLLTKYVGMWSFNSSVGYTTVPPYFTEMLDWMTSNIIPATSSVTPSPLGTPSPGTSNELARADHIHPIPSPSDVGALPIIGGTLTGSLSLGTVGVGLYMRDMGNLDHSIRYGGPTSLFDGVNPDGLVFTGRGGGLFGTRQGSSGTAEWQLKWTPSGVDVKKALSVAGANVLTTATGYTKGEIDTKLSTLMFSSITNRPTTLSGYGITDAYTSSAVQSRGMNLITNGTGLMGSNFNFSSWTFYPEDTYVGGGSFLIASPSAVLLNDELIPVIPDNFYKLRMYLKSIDMQVNNAAYGMVACFDVDGLSITPANYTYYENVTTLTQPLSKGDTVIHVSNTSNWQLGAENNRYIKIHRYKNGRGFVWGEKTYSRHVMYRAFDDVGIDDTAKTITLKTPWSIDNPETQDKVWPVGTPIGTCYSGGTYLYPTNISNRPILEQWTLAEGVFGGLSTTGGVVSRQFPVGTAFIKVGILANRMLDSSSTPPVSNKTLMSGVYLTEIVSENLTGGLAGFTGNFQSADVITVTNGVITGKTSVSPPWSPIDSPTFTGVPTGPTASAGNSSTQLATTAFVVAADTAQSTAFNTSLLTKADLDSPTFTGIPTAPTPLSTDNSTRLATSAFVTTAIAALNSALTPSINTRAPLASPALTGIPTAPTAAAGTNTQQLATTAFVFSGLSLKSNLASPAFTGVPTAPTAAAGNNTTQLATTAFVTAGLSLKANLSGPAFTGVPTAPTAAAGTNTTQLSTTAFVTAAVGLKASLSGAVFTGAVVFNGGATVTNPGTGDNSTKVANTAFVVSAISGKSDLASPVFTGVPAGPTAAPGTNTSQLATTAFVTNGLSSKANLSGPAFTGIPTAPTAGSETSTDQIATTAFVRNVRDLAWSWSEPVRSRLGVTAQMISDWNDAQSNGWYMGSDILNAPAPGWFIGTVQNHGNAGWCVQTVIEFTAASEADTVSYQRSQTNGTWNSWYRLRVSEKEIQTMIQTMIQASTSGKVPRGSGGTIGRVTSRAGADDTRVDLTPSAPAWQFTPERLALIDINNSLIPPGSTGDVTGLPGFVAGKQYYIDFPTGGGTNLKPYPDPVPEDFPDRTLLNSDRRFYRAGVAFSSGSKMMFSMFSDSIVVVSNESLIPPTELDLQTPAYNTNLIGGYLTSYLTYDGGANGSSVLKADGDSPQPATSQLSTVTRNIGGTVKGVFITERNYGTPKLVGITSQTDRIGGDILARFQISSTNWDSAQPSLFFGWNGTPTNGSFYRLTLTGNGGSVWAALTYVTTVNNVLSASSRGSGVSTGVPLVKEIWFSVRIRVNAATKTASVRFWNDASTEPTTWTLTDIPLPELVAGKSGWTSKDGYYEINMFKATDGGVIA